jgi:tripartite-type tricarboxylate transporter receptor subunit TctC
MRQLVSEVQAALETARHLVRGGGALLAVLLLAVQWVASPPAAAQEPARSDAAYPSRPIKLIVPYSPGGSTDLTARTVAQKLSESLGQPVLVENRPGANGSLGAGIVAKSAPDGYTLLLAERGAMTINPSLYRSLPFDSVRDFEYIGIATFGAYVLVINPELPARTFAEFVQFAMSKPGAIFYGSQGIGSMTHLNAETLNSNLNIKLMHVPYKGAVPATAAVLAGEVGMTLSSVPAVLGFVRDGRIRALAIGSTGRSPLLPDVPTFAEAGGGADTVVPTYSGFAAPAGTPRAIVAKLNAEIRRALGQRDVAERLVGAGLDPSGSSPEEMTELIKRDLDRFARLVKAIGIKPE